MDKIIVAYYTEGPYEAEAERLERSLNRLGLRYFFMPIREDLSWLDAVHFRAAFLLLMQQKYPDTSILSLDADCVVHSDPWVGFEEKVFDIGVHKLVRPGLPDEYLPGTLFIHPAPGARDLLLQWDTETKNQPLECDSVCFNLAIKSYDYLTIAQLPPEHCWVFDISKEAYGDRQPVIEHLQASRSFRNPEKKSGSAFKREKRLEELSI